MTDPQLTVWDQSVAPILRVHAKKRRAKLDKLGPVVLRVGRAAGRDGFTMDNVKRAAGLPVKSEGRELSYLGVLPHYYGLVNTGRRRMNGTRNQQTVWVLPGVQP